MKVKTSVTLSEELLKAISVAINDKTRSAFIEEAAWEYLKMRNREIRDRRELRAIDTNVDRLNEEALDVLQYQDDE